MKCILTTNAAGHVLCHDLTRIVRGETKGAAFKKGHIVTAEDIPVLLSMGKEHLYVWEVDESKLHENDAAEILAGICESQNMHRSEIREGKIELISDIDGLFTVDVPRLDQINALDEIMIATRHTNTVVKPGDKLCGARVIPLVIDKARMEAARTIGAEKPLLSVRPFLSIKAGIVTTGNEVFHGRIQDTFTPVVMDKLAEFSIQTVAHEVSDDGIDHVVEAISRVREKGVDLVLCTGGMSVDPDDMTPAAIKKSGASIVTYGAPVLPGAMFLMGYYDDGTPVMGLPGCVMYAKRTIFDLVLPRVAAGVRLDKKDFSTLGCGGLCLGCENCTYPNCGFGK